MYYGIDWIEDKNNCFRRVFWAKDFETLWRAVKYMNLERKENGRPVMEYIRVNVMNKYDGEFSNY